MSHLPSGFAERYGAALDAYVATGGDSALAGGRELGAQAVSDGVAIADVAALHFQLAGAHGDGLARARHFFGEFARAFDDDLKELRRSTAAMKQTSLLMDQLVTQGIERYHAMFDDNPMPMWIYDKETLG